MHTDSFSSSVGSVHVSWDNTRHVPSVGRHRCLGWRVQGENVCSNPLTFVGGILQTSARSKVLFQFLPVIKNDTPPTPNPHPTHPHHLRKKYLPRKVAPADEYQSRVSRPSPRRGSVRDAAEHLINGQKVNIASVPALVCWALTSSYSLWVCVLGAPPSVSVHFSVLALCFNRGMK